MICTAESAHDLASGLQFCRSFQWVRVACIFVWLTRERLYTRKLENQRVLYKGRKAAGFTSHAALSFRTGKCSCCGREERRHPPHLHRSPVADSGCCERVIFAQSEPASTFHVEDHIPTRMQLRKFYISPPGTAEHSTFEEVKSTASLVPPIAAPERLESGTFDSRATAPPRWRRATTSYKSSAVCDNAESVSRVRPNPPEAHFVVCPLQQDFQAPSSRGTNSQSLTMQTQPKNFRDACDCKCGSSCSCKDCKCGK
jgi:hypothetical protein